MLVEVLTEAICCTSPSHYSRSTPLKNLDINRLAHPAQPLTGSSEDSANLPDPRILVLSVSPDVSYIPVMNSIFSTQKPVSEIVSCSSYSIPYFHRKITIDVCKIFGPDSVLFQQAGGSHIRLVHREALLQYLIVHSFSHSSFVSLTVAFQMSFLPMPSIRKIITVPMGDKDFRAACFCLKHVVDVGYVCISSLVHPFTLSTYLC